MKEEKEIKKKYYENIRKVYKNIGENIKTFRKSKGLTLREVAQFLGVTMQQLQKYEIGQDRTSLVILYKLCDVFSVSLSELLGKSIVSNGKDKLIRDAFYKVSRTIMKTTDDFDIRLAIDWLDSVNDFIQAISSIIDEHKKVSNKVWL